MAIYMAIYNSSILKVQSFFSVDSYKIKSSYIFPTYNNTK